VITIEARFEKVTANGNGRFHKWGGFSTLSFTP